MNKTFTAPVAVAPVGRPFDLFIEKAGQKYTIDFAALPTVSQDRVIRYGLEQLLSDAASSVATTDKVGNNRVQKKGADLAKAQVAARELIDRRVADLSAGILRRVRESSIDPVESEARQIAIKAIKSSPKWLAWLAENSLGATDKEAVSELATRAAALAKQPKVQALAAKRVAEMGDLDLDESEAA